AGVAAAHPCGLHAPGGGQVGGAEAHALHPGAGGGDLLHVGDTERRLEDGVDEQRAADPGPGFQLGQEAVHEVDVPGPLDLGDHDDVELVADLAHHLGQVVEHPGRVEAVDPGPQLGVTQVHLPAHPD